MELDDRITIQTPEGVTLELTLAGLGSRAAASLLDTIIKGFVLLVVLIFSWFLSGLGEDGSALATAFVWIVFFSLFFVYDIAFETLNSGRTPGKQATGIRVVTVGGGPVGFTTSAIRNIIRIVDLLPGVYFIGIIAIATTAKHQRLGDIAASTVVIRDRRGARNTGTLLEDIPATTGPAWDVSGVTSAEVAVVRQFLERRDELDPDTRRRIAATIADPLRARVFGPDAGVDSERFLERLSAEKASRG
ncbi:MAG: RDD family protein [Acidimicrobiia bacterium]|nr:RDD family protein [Acidimicrobiia bacterium]